MKLIQSLDRASAQRMAISSRARHMILGIGMAVACLLFTLPASAAEIVPGATSGEISDAAPGVLAAGLIGAFAFAGGFREEEPGHPSGGGSGAPAATDDPKLTIGARLTAALSSREDLQKQIAARDSQLTEHASQVEKLTGELTAAQSELAEASARIAELEGQASEVENALKASETEIAGLQAAATTVEKKAQEKVASLGFPAAQLPAASDADPEDAAPSTREELAAAIDAAPNAQERSKILQSYRKAAAAASQN
jgi:hypothetical protein